MVTKNIDVDAVVAKARELAEYHGWCDVVEDALVELGLVENNEYSGELLIKVPFSGIRVPAGEDADKWLKENISIAVFVENTDNSDYIFDGNAPDFEVTAQPGPAPVGANWYYASNEGRVLHWVGRQSSRYGTYYAVACGGIYTSENLMTKSSPRGEDRKCAKCARAHPND